MSYNPGIILAGQSGPNIMSALSGGLQTGQMRNEIGDQNALRSLYREQGAAIRQGDEGALNALAGLNPGAALGVEETRLGMDNTRQQMRVREEQLQLARAAGARAAANHAQSLSAAERQQEREQIAQGLATAIPALRGGDLDGVNRILRTAGLDPAPDIDSAAMVIAQYEGALEQYDAAQSVLGGGGSGPDLQNVGGVVYDFSQYDGSPNSLQPLTGAQPGEAEAEISRIMETGVNRETAILIRDGVVRISRDPVTGSAQLVDLRTGQVVDPGQGSQPAPPSVFNADPSPAQTPSPAPASTTPEAESVLPGDVDFTSTLGLEGAVANTVNALTDFVAGVRVFEEAGEARTALNNARTRILTTLATVTVPGRPSNYVMEMFNQNVVGNARLGGPSGARDTATQTLSFLQGMIRENEEILRSRVSPATRSEAQRNLSMLRGLEADYNTIVDGLSGQQGVRGGGNRTSSGVTWEIVQ